MTKKDILNSEINIILVCTPYSPYSTLIKLEFRSLIPNIFEIKIQSFCLVQKFFSITPIVPDINEEEAFERRKD